MMLSIMEGAILRVLGLAFVKNRCPDLQFVPFFVSRVLADLDLLAADVDAENAAELLRHVPYRPASLS